MSDVTTYRSLQPLGPHIKSLMLRLLGMSCLIFCMVIMEMYVVAKTSALTLSEAGSRARLNESYQESGCALSYRGCHFHRIVKGFVAQGGDFVKNNGSGGAYAYRTSKAAVNQMAKSL